MQTHCENTVGVLMATKTPGYDAAQLVCLVTGIQLGAVPLVQAILGARQGGVFGWLFGGLDLAGAWRYVVPSAVVMAMVVAILALGTAKEKKRA